MMNIFASILTCVSVTATAQPSIVPIGVYPGAASGIAIGVSPDGRYVVGDSAIGLAGTDIPFIWSRESGRMDLEIPDTGAFYTGGTVSHDGRYATGLYVPDGGLGSAGWVWSQETGVIQLGSLPGGNMSTGVGFVGHTTEFAIGSSSVGYTATGQNLFRPVKWTFDGGLEELPLPTPTDANFTSSAGYVTTDGRIWIRAQSGNWLWSEQSGYEFVNEHEGLRYISSDGAFMAGIAADPVNASTVPAYWTPENGLAILPMLYPENFGQVFGMSGDGSVIIGELYGGPRTNPIEQVIWINQGDPIRIEDYAANIGIDLTGWIILDVFDVSEDGSTIVGQAGYNGLVQGFVLTIPAPAGALPLAVLGLMVFNRRRSSEQAQ